MKTRSEATRAERSLDRLVGRQLRERFKRGGADDILRTYLRLHERTRKIAGEHWLWCALERIAAGEKEERVLNDYMYIYSSPGKKKLDALLAGRAREPLTAEDFGALPPNAELIRRQPAKRGIGPLERRVRVQPTRN